MSRHELFCRYVLAEFAKRRRLLLLPGAPDESSGVALLFRLRHVKTKRTLRIPRISDADNVVECTLAYNLRDFRRGRGPGEPGTDIQPATADHIRVPNAGEHCATYL